MRVWIDQDLCTGDGLCSDHAPDVFTLLEDGIAYVVEDGVPQNDPGGPGSLVDVPAHLDDDVVRAAEVCPGECIFLEVVEEEERVIYTMPEPAAWKSVLFPGLNGQHSANKRNRDKRAGRRGVA